MTAVAQAGECGVRASIVVPSARLAATPAVHRELPNMACTVSPTTAQSRWPPMTLRGCASGRVGTLWIRAALATSGGISSGSLKAAPMATSRSRTEVADARVCTAAAGVGLAGARLTVSARSLAAGRDGDEGAGAAGTDCRSVLTFNSSGRRPGHGGQVGAAGRRGPTITLAPGPGRDSPGPTTP